MGSKRLAGAVILQPLGIMMIVLGGIFLGLILIGNIGINEMAEKLGRSPKVALVIMIHMVVTAFLYMGIGAFALKNCNNKDKASFCIMLGIIMAGLSMFGIAYELATNLDTITIGRLLKAFLIPGLFIWGSMRNKNS